RAGDRDGHPAVLEGAGGILSLDLHVELDLAADPSREPRRGHERRPALEQGDDRLLGNLGQDLAIFPHHAAPGRRAIPASRAAHRSKILTARGVFRIEGRALMLFTASRTSRSRAWCV